MVLGFSHRGDETGRLGRKVTPPRRAKLSWLATAFRAATTGRSDGKRKQDAANVFLTLAASRNPLPAIKLNVCWTGHHLAACRKFLNRRLPASWPTASKPRTAVLGSGTAIAPMRPFVASAVYPAAK
jgi:hypothetical protein